MRDDGRVRTEAAPEKQSQVSAQIAKQNDALTTLSSTVSKLEDCLGSVLNPEQTTKAQSEPEQELVCLASQIRDNTYTVEAQAAKLHQIISRLEL